MKIDYDTQTNTLSIIFKNDKITESEESRPGIIMDYNDKNEIVSLEILDASKHVPETKKIEFQTV